MKYRTLVPTRQTYPLIAAIASLVSSTLSHAAPIWYDGGTNNWTTLTAWSTVASAASPDPTAVPGSADDLTFNRTNNNAAANTISFAGGGRAARSMTFNTSGTSLFRANASGTTTARTLSLGTGGLTINSGAGAVTIGDTPATFGAINVALTASQTWTNNSSNTFTLAGIVSGGFNLTKSGTTQIRLNGANTLTGSVTVDQGDLSIGNYAGLNTVSGITVSGGTAGLNLVQVGAGSTTNTINKPLSLHGFLRIIGGSGTNLLALSWDGNTTLTGDSTITNNGNSTFDINGPIDLGSHTLTFQADRSGSTIDGIISGTGSFIKTSPQNLTLRNANTFSGNITVNGGTLIGTGATNSPGVSVFGARDNTRTITINTGGTLQFNSGNILGANHVATTAPTLVINSGGTVTNGGAATNNALNDVQLNGGTLTSTTGHTSSSEPFTPVYGAWNINGTVTSTGNSTISTSDASKGWIMLKVVGDKTTNFDVTSGTLTVSAPVVDNPTDGNIGSLSKSGAGTMTLSAINTYTGSTTVTAGTLALSGAGDINTTSGITVNGADAKFNHASSVAITPVVTLTQGTVTGSGTINTVNVADGATNVVSNNNGVAGAPLTVGALSFNGAASINTFNNSSSAAIVTTSLSSNVAGLITVNPSAASWAAGTYDLISYGGGSIGGAGFSQFQLGTVSGVSPRQTRVLGNSGTAITLTVGADDTPYWVGDGDGKWNLASTNNWKLSSNNAYTTFLAFDNAIFDDNATGAGPVVVDIDTAPIDITTATFNNATKDYVLSGAFGISSGSLTKSGNGTLTITNANSYTGNTLVNGGVLDLSTDGAQLYNSANGVAAVVTVTNGGVLVVRNYGQANTSGLGSPSLGNLNNGGGQVVLDGGTLRFNNETGTRGRKTDIGAGGGTLDVVNNSSLILNTTGNFNFSGPSTLTLTGDSSSTGTIQGVIAGTDVSLVKTGASTWTLSGTNTYTGTTTISEGTLAMGTSNRIASSSKISIAGGAKLDFNVGGSANFILSSDQDVEGTGTGIANLNTGNSGVNGVRTTGNNIFSHTGSGTLVLQRIEVFGTGNEITGGNIQTGVAATRRGLLVGNNTSGTLTISGGTLTSIGGDAQPDCIGANGVTGTFNITGGNYINSGTLSFGVGNTAHPGGTLNLNSGSATIGTLLYNANATGGQGILNLNGGTLTVGAITSTSGQTKEFNFDGGLFVAAGNLTLPADVNVGVKDGGANINTNGFSATIASPMLNAGTGGLIKSGLGTLTLSGANTYAGGTSVTAGTLRFSSAVASTTDVNVSPNAEAGALIAADDAQWINTGSLTLQNSAAVLIDYGSSIPTTNTSFTPVSVTNFAINSTPGVRIAGSSVPNMQVGTTYPLVTWSGSGPTDPAAFSLLTHRLAGNFTIAGNTLSLTVTANANGLPISWNTGDGTWNTSSINWADGSLVNTAYADTLDAVIFGDSAGVSGSPVVTLNSTVSPVNMTMNTTGRNYTISGTGAISGSGGLLLSSSNVGTLTLATGNNTFSGGTIINGGTLALGHATDTLPDSGTVNVDGATAVLNTGSNADTVGTVSLKNGASITGTGTLTGTSYAVENGLIAANLAGTGALTKTTSDSVTLAGTNTYTGGTSINQGTLVLRNQNALPATGTHLLAVGTTVEISSDTAFTNLATIAASSGGSTTSFVSNRETAGAGLIHTLGTLSLGNTTFNFTKGANVASGDAGFAISSLGLIAGGAGTVILNPIDTTLGITGLVNIPSNNHAKTLALAGETTGNSISGSIENGINTLSLTKQGTSTWTITGNNSYTGATTIDQGTMVFATNDQSLTGALNFGASAGSTNVGTLDLSAASATFGGGLLVRSNSASNNLVTIGAGETLTFTGSSITNPVVVGNNASSVLANFQASGAGTLTINEVLGNIVVASADAGGASAQMDLAGLANFNATVANVYIGRPTTAVGAATGGRPADAMNLAATNNITVSGNLVVGAQAAIGFQGFNFLRLGTTNTINANNIVVGNGRIHGSFLYNTDLTNPTTTLRGATGGDSRVNITLGDQANASGVGTGGGGSNQITGTMNFTGGTVDARIDTLLMGVGGATASNNRGRGIGNFTFGAGSNVNINTLIIGRATNNTATASSQSPGLAGNGTFTMNGGSLVINTAITIANDNDTSNTTNGIQNIAGTFEQTDGTATIGTSESPVNIVMGSHITDGNSGSANATITLTGGTTSVNGNILEGNLGAGTITSTFTLNGGSLDMNGDNIGVTGSTIDNLNFESGTLKNVASINGNGGLTKTTAGTLVLDGILGYTGATTISAGTLKLAEFASVTSSSALNIDAAGTFDTTSVPTYAIAASQPVTITIDPTDTGSSGKIAAAGLNITNAAVTLNPTAALNDPVYVLATYSGTLTGTAFASVTGLPSGYTLEYAYEGNKIALVQQAGFASWIAGTFANGTVDIAKRGPNDDPDNDGIPNLLEYAIAGQDPTVANTALGTITGSSLSYEKRQPLAGDLTYSIVESTDLGQLDDWTEVSGAGYTNNGTTVSYSYTPGTPARNFFQLKVTQTAP